MTSPAPTIVDAEPAPAAEQPFLLADQIVFLSTLKARCENRSGGVARETFLHVTDDDLRKVDAVTKTLITMSAHAPALRLLVTGKGKVYEFGKGRKPD